MTVTIKPDGTLIVNTIFYPKVKRVLVECGTKGKMFYADEQKIGGWKINNDINSFLYEKIVCSCCGNPCLDYDNEYIFTDYCPFCGCRMLNNRRGE